MRILITTFTYAPQMNGVAQVVSAHVKEFIRHGHEVTVATGFDKHRNIDDEMIKGVRVVQFKVIGTPDLRGGYHGEVSKYQDFISDWTGDLIMCHCWAFWPTDLAILQFPYVSAKKILVSHGCGLRRYPANTIFPRGLVSLLSWRPYVWRMGKVMRKFDRVVFLSDKFDKKVYYDHWLARKEKLENISVIPTGVYPKEFDAVVPTFRTTYGIGNKLLVLCVSSYDRHKNQMLALRAFIRANPRDAMLILIGGPHTEYFRELEMWYRQSSSRQKVLFLSNLDRQTICSAFNVADLCLCSSLRETGPLVVLEAMAARTPFISTDVGFVSVLPGGIVVRNETAMVEAICELLGDEKRRRDLGKEGRCAIEKKYNWVKIGEQYESLIQSLVREHRCE